MTAFEQMAEYLEAAADLCLKRPDGPVVTRSPISNAVFDCKVIEQSLGTDRPASWISELGYTYLLESAHQLGALVILLRAGHVAGVVEGTVRAIVERAGRVRWVLDPGTVEERAASNEGRDFADVRRRAVRASFEMLVCLQHERRTAEDLGQPADVRKALRDALRSNRTLVTDEWFKTEKPPVNKLDPSLGETSDISKWTIGGEPYPTFKQFSFFALSDGTLSMGHARGLYSVLSGWSHPNFLAARIHETPAGDRYTHTAGHLKDLLELGLRSFAGALLARVEYHDVDRNRIGGDLDEVMSGWRDLAARVDEAREDSPPDAA
jgi:hypothetical protein